MSIVLSSDLFTWLLSHSILSLNDVLDDINGSRVLSETVSTWFSDGIPIGRVVDTLSRMRGGTGMNWEKWKGMEQETNQNQIPIMIQSIEKNQNQKNQAHIKNQNKNQEKHQNQIRNPTQTHKNSSNQKQRQCNWNLLQEELNGKLGVNLDNDLKALIVSGDQEVLVQLIGDIFENEKNNNIEIHGNGTKKRFAGNKLTVSAVDNNHKKDFVLHALSPNHSKNQSIGMDASKESIVTFLAELVAKIFPMDIKHANELVIGASTPNGNFGNETVAKCFKNWSDFFNVGFSGSQSASKSNPFSNSLQLGSFLPLTNWLREVFTHSAKLAQLASASRESLLILLRLLQPALLTPNVEIASWTSRCYSQIIGNLEEKCKDDLYNWFIGVDSKLASNALDTRNLTLIGTGLRSFISCFNRHPDIKISLFGMLDNICKSRCFHFFTQAVNADLNSPSAMIPFIHELLPVLKTHLTISRALVADGIIDYWVDFACKHAECSAGVSAQLLTENADVTVALSLALILQLWMDFPDQVDSRTEVTQNILTLLRKGVRHSSKSVTLSTIVNLFQALDFFTEEKSRFAPFIYKVLVFSLVEHYPNEPIRDFIASNFCQCLTKLNNLPVHIILDPLLKQMALHGFSNLDFDLLLAIAKHPRLPVKHGLLLAHQLGKLALQDLVFGRCASIPFLVLINRYIGEDAMLRYCEKYIKVDLSLFMKSFEDEKLQNANSSITLLDNSIYNQKRSISLELLAKLVHLKIQKLIDQYILPSLNSVIVEFQTLYGFKHGGLQSLASYTQQQLHLIDEESGAAAVESKTPSAIGLLSNRSISEVDTDSAARETKSFAQIEGNHSNLLSEDPKPLKIPINSFRDIKSINLTSLRSELLPVQKRKSIASNDARETNAIDGWPSAEVANVFRREFIAPMTKLFKLFLGQRPALVKVKSFEDLERIRSLLSFAEFHKLYTDLQLSPQPFSKVDLGFIFTTANRGKHSDLKAQVMALDEFLKSLWLVCQELQKRNLASWLNVLDPALISSQPDQARTFILFLKQRCLDIEYAPLIEIWKHAKPKSIFASAPSESLASNYLSQKGEIVKPASIAAVQIIHCLLANALKMQLVPHYTDREKFEKNFDRPMPKALKSKQMLEEEKKKQFSEEKEKTEKKAKELQERLALQRLEKEKREAEKKVLLEAQKQEAIQKKNAYEHRLAIEKEEKKALLEEYRKQKQEESKIAFQNQKTSAEAELFEKKKKLEEWQKNQHPISAASAKKVEMPIKAPDRIKPESRSKSVLKVSASPTVEISVGAKKVRTDAKESITSAAKSVSKAPIFVAKPVAALKGETSVSRQAKISKQLILSPTAAATNEKMKAIAKKVNNASETELQEIREKALQDLASAQNQVADILKRATSTRVKHENSVAPVDEFTQVKVSSGLSADAFDPLAELELAAQVAIREHNENASGNADESAIE